MEIIRSWTLKRTNVFMKVSILFVSFRSYIFQRFGGESTRNDPEQQRPSPSGRIVSRFISRAVVKEVSYSLVWRRRTLRSENPLYQKCVLATVSI